MYIRIIPFEDLKDYAEANRVFNTRDLKMNFRISQSLANYYCEQLIEKGAVNKIGKQSGIHGKPSNIYKSLI